MTPRSSGKYLYDLAATPVTGFAAHEYRVGLLDTLAQLTGCHESFGGEFPDGSRPDVLKIDSRRGLLFIGDAKNTESPQNRDTQARLQRYVSWLAAHVNAGRQGIFALCFRQFHDLPGWVKTMEILTSEVELYTSTPQWEMLESEVFVLWFRVQPNIESSDFKSRSSSL